MEAPEENGSPAPEKGKKRRRNRSREGGYKRMKGNLYARIQYMDESGKQKEKLRRVPSGKINDVWAEVRKMRDELNHFGDETLQSDKLTLNDLADKYQKAKVFEAMASTDPTSITVAQHNNNLMTEPDTYLFLLLVSGVKKKPIPRAISISGHQVRINCAKLMSR